MGEKLPVISGKELLGLLVKQGCKVLRIKGSHYVLKSCQQPRPLDNLGYTASIDSQKRGFNGMSFTTNITIPQEIVLSLRESGDSIVKEMKRTVAAKYYREQKLSLGQCAELAEMSKTDFIELLSSYNISIFNFENDEEILEDIKNA